MARPKKAQEPTPMTESKSYWLCSQCQDKKDGHKIDTVYNVDDFEDVDSFLLCLYKHKIIKKEEVDTIVSVYYGD